jgi:phosphate transport system substrate-binding protein
MSCSRFGYLGTLFALMSIPLYLGCGGNHGGKVKIIGGGATFVQPIMKEWTLKYDEMTNGKVIIDYQGGGSGKGLTQMTDEVFFFGCSDAPMSKDFLEKAKARKGDVIHIPLVIGAVVVPYNLPTVREPLCLTGEVIADIFLLKITKWNDPKIQGLNAGITLPDLDITPIVRGEGSGTSAIFTEYLSKVSEDFRKQIKPSTTPTWPKGTNAEKESNGVVLGVKKKEGAICYVELAYALQNQVQYAKVRNQAGKDVLPTLESISAAAEATLGLEQKEEPYSLHQLAYSLTNAPGEKSYPISAMSYCVIYQKLPSNKGKPFVEFLSWATTEGQEMSKQKDYAPLPKSLQEKIASRLNDFEFES